MQSPIQTWNTAGFKYNGPTKIIINLENLPDVTNDAYYPLYDNKSRYLVLKGGGSSGKSVFAAQKTVKRILTEPGHRILVIRKVGKTLRESVFTELKSVIYTWNMQDLFKIPRGSSSELHIQCVNGNEILFSGLDDVEKLKSIVKITSIWVEEASELTVEDYRQLDIRMRGISENYQQFIFTFNPININHWLKKEFFDIVKEDSTVVETIYKDNRFLNEAAIKVLEGFKDTDEYYYTVYCLNQWGVIGKTVFNAMIVTQRLMAIKDRKPLKQGYFIFDYVHEKIIDSTIKWIDDENGYITIYRDVETGYPYVNGGDTAGEGSNWFTGEVLDNVTGEQVAELRQQFDEDLYARQMYCLGKYYNYALIGIETNYSTHPVRELTRLGYLNQYVREHLDSFTGKMIKAYGFLTGKTSRPVIIANLVQVARESSYLFNSTITLDEMLTFVRNEQGKPEAQEGCFDDCVLGLAIAHHIRGQQTYKVKTPKKEKTLIEKDIEKIVRQQKNRTSRRY